MAPPSLFLGWDTPALLLAAQCWPLGCCLQTRPSYPRPHLQVGVWGACHPNSPEGREDRAGTAQRLVTALACRGAKGLSGDMEGWQGWPRALMYMGGARAGLAAGFDKDAEGVEGLLGMGFGFVEVGAAMP